MRSFGDGPHSFEHRSSDKTPSPNFHTKPIYTRAFGDESHDFEPWPQVTWTTPELAPHTNGRTFQLSTDLTCIAALHGGSLVVLGSNS
ncbi:hypothetical protein TNCV_439971 [Trichonephila clavipes]|nr:hypothetical protein TNCV_439971 [Trichonephila clavipes]